ncbi:MAG: helix-turn-helix transcriptional regulator [Gammaproteobacteria bacterium]|nr:helix-turn-helix transcriptional regulator [Gammaproteobacteria bacterium]
MKGYSQFCPVAKGAEIFNERWTPLIIREMMCGSRRFNDLKRGNPMMSPSLLSQRLKFLEQAGVVEKKTGKGESAEYSLTESGRDLGEVVTRLGLWGLKWARSRLTKDDYDPQLLMWDIRRRIDTSAFPAQRVVMSFMFRDMPASRRAYWLIVDDGEVDLCIKFPGFDVDLAFITTSKTMADIWMGHTTIRKEIRNGNLSLEGGKALKKNIDDWFTYSVFSDPEALRASLS